MVKEYYFLTPIISTHYQVKNREEKEEELLGMNLL